jgi:predicted nuclease with TOPRIM domain
MSHTPLSDSTPHNIAELGMLCRRLERQLNETDRLAAVRLDYIKNLERELNASNDYNREIRERNEWLNDKIDAASQRIKRLEEDSQRLNWLLNRGLAWRDCYDDWWKKGEWLYASQSALETIDKAREAKL